MKNKTRLFSALWVIGLGGVFFVASVAIGPRSASSATNFGYGYDCGKEYGYGYHCNKQSVSYKKYKEYREVVKGAKSVYKKSYFKVRYLRQSKNPVLRSQYAAMRKVYQTHKFDKRSVFEKLNPKTKEMYKTYRKYRMYWQYKKYRKAVFD